MNQESLFTIEASVLAVLLFSISVLEIIATTQIKNKKSSVIYLSYEKDLLLMLYGGSWFLISIYILETSNQIIKLISACILFLMIVFSKTQKRFSTEAFDWLVIIFSIIAIGTLILF